MGKLRDGSKSSTIKPPISSVVTTTKKKASQKSVIKSPLNCVNRLSKAASKGKTIDGSNYGANEIILKSEGDCTNTNTNENTVVEESGIDDSNSLLEPRIMANPAITN